MKSPEPDSKNELVVRVLKYDGVEYRRWNARLARRDDSLLVLDAEFEVEVQHEMLGTIARGTKTIEYYWFDRWFNVFRCLKPDGETLLYYCNVNLPPSLYEAVLSYVDLDIDILVSPNLSYEILDLEEFESNAEFYQYPRETQLQARAAVDQLISLIESREFPFFEV